YGCAFCGKGVQNSNLVSFSKNRVNIIRRPNLHTHRMKVGGETVKLRLCTKCKRAVRAGEKATVAMTTAKL
ncbi:MAG: bL28 family ribosomal protein, partial [Patescibacteria group bacterium]